MVKAFQLLEACLASTQTFINRALSLFRSILPTNRSKMGKPVLVKKKKYISKSGVRAFVRSKLMRKRRNNRSQGQREEREEVQVVSRDKTNEEKDEEKLSIEEIDAKFAQFIRKNEEELICSVCRSIILLPAITDCSHIFCLECIQNSLIISNKCPLCRCIIATDQSYGINRLKAIERIIEIKNVQKEDKDSLARIEEHFSWKNNRFVDADSLEQGLKVDIWKVDLKEWKKGEICQVYEDEYEMVASVLVSFDNLTKEHNEIIEMPSFRLAKFNFYSNKYENDEFSFPDLHLRHSNRINADFDFSFIPPFRRTLHQHLNNFNSPQRRFSPLRFGTLLRRPFIPIAPAQITSDNHSNQEQTESRSQNISRANNSDNHQSPEDFFQFLQLGPESESPAAPSRNDPIQMDLLPNLNPGEEFRRQALSSSEDENQEDLQIFEINDF